MRRTAPFIAWIATAGMAAAGPVSLLSGDSGAVPLIAFDRPVAATLPDAGGAANAATPAARAPHDRPTAGDRTAGALLAASLAAALTGDDASGVGSLFSDRNARGAFFAPGGPLWGDDGQPVETAHRAPLRGATGPTARLLDLIASAEAGRAGYDAVQHGARIRPQKPPTAMTLAEIEAWTVATPRQPHAIGRYQFIPSTLRRLVKAEGLPPDTRFTPAVQDRLADRLLVEAGLRDFRGGNMSRTTFMRNLARIWAGLPLPDGRSYYQGYAGNKATISWDQFETTMRTIFPGG